MARNKPRSGTGVRILMGIARVLAAAIIAVAASAALADLDLRPTEFSRILPVVLTGEGIIYILMLGGGTVAAPILLLTVLLGFAVRAGIAVAAGALSPQVSGDLLASAQFFYASYWPAALAQVLMVAVALRLLRPLVATRTPRRRRGRPEVSEALEEEREDERRDVLLEALAEAPEEPPVSPTMLEEQQIGDLAEAAEPELTEEQIEQALALPFEEEADEEIAPAEEPAADEEEPDADEPLPPGVIDATPEAAARAAEQTEEEPRSEENEPEAAPEQIPPEQRPEPAPEPAGEASGEVGEETATLAPVQSEPDPGVGELEPPENLQGMIDVISRAAGADTDVRVWRTSDGRTVLAAVPSGTPAAGTGGHADALVSAHLEICSWMGAEPTSQQLAATGIGAWVLQALDADGAVMLIMAARGDAAAGRIQLAGGCAAEAVRGMAEEAHADGALEEPDDAASALPLNPETEIAEALSDVASMVGGRFAGQWRAWRGPHRRVVAVHASMSAEAEAVARRVARMVAPVERFADAVALDGPQWLALSASGSLLALHWAERKDESIVLAATVSGTTALGRVRWELGEMARQVAED